MNEEMVTRKTWAEFRDSKMLWFANRILHVFGWAVVYDYSEDGKTLTVYPARVKYRGFDEKTDTEGFIGISAFIKENAEVLEQEAKS